MDEEKLIRIDAGGWGLTWAVDGNGVLRQVGLGPQGHTAELQTDPVWYPTAFPTWGDPDPYRAGALRVTHSDGTLTTRLRFVGVDRRVEVDRTDEDRVGADGVQANRVDQNRVDTTTESAVGASPPADPEHVVVHLSDAELPLDVDLHLRTHPRSGVLEQWVEIQHDQGGPVRLGDYDSIAPFLLISDDAEVCHFGWSGWADEWRWTTQTLGPGVTSLASLGGLQPHLQRSPCVLVSPSGPSAESSGDVIGVSIAWGGNTRVDLDVRPRAEP